MGICSAKQKPVMVKQPSVEALKRNSSKRQSKDDNTVGSARTIQIQASPRGSPIKSKFSQSQKSVHIKLIIPVPKDYSKFSQFYSVLPPQTAEYSDARIFRIKQDVHVNLVQHNVAGTIHEMISIAKSEEYIQKLVDEFQKHQPIHHNLMAFNEIYFSEDHYFLLCNKIDKKSCRLDKYVKERTLTEKQILSIIYQILSALDCLHKRQMIHGALSMKSFQIIEHKSGELHIVLSQLLDITDHSRIDEEQLYYLSPEYKLDQSPTQERNIWACGIIMFQLIHQQFPFEPSKDPHEYQNQLSTLHINFETQELKPIQKQTKELLIQLLMMNPNLRPSSSVLLKHKAFKILIDKTETAQIICDFSKQVKLNYLQTSILIYIVYNVYRHLITQAQLIFSKIDKNDSGHLTKQELQSFFNKKGSKEQQSSSESITEKIMEILDLDENGSIDFNDFLIGYLDRRVILQYSSLITLFNELCEKTNRISSDALIVTFSTPAKLVKYESIIRNFKTLTCKQIHDYLNIDCFADEIVA